MSVRSIWSAAFAASIAVLFFGIWFQVSTARHWTRTPLPYGVNNPGLAIQMAKEPWPSAMLEPGENRAEIARQQYIDYGYIPSYVALFVLVAILQSYSTRRWVWALAPICIVVILIGATYDLLENRAILGVTEHGDISAWAYIRPNSLVKWSCAFLVILFEAPFYLTVDSRSAIARLLARVIGMAAVLAGAVGFFSSITGNERGIGMALLPLLVAMLLMPVFLWIARPTRPIPA
jgi:hypothetical protein